jgi:glyoxylate/hydroxypyruvate/2-ketogluconate reductase
MKKRVVVYKRVPPLLVARLQQHFEVTCFDGVTPENRAAFQAALRTAHGMIGASVKFDAKMLDGAENLEIASTISVGYDAFDIPYLLKRGIMLTHTPDILTDSVADLVMALILATSRRIVELDGFIRAGKWKQSVEEEAFGLDVHHRTLGLIGMGRIAAAVAKRAHHGFGMKIIYDDHKRVPAVEAEFGAVSMPVAELLAQADYVCPLLPYRPENDKLFGKAEFARMKPSAIFINASRGKVVDEAALIAALEDGTIRAAGLDVFEVEPLAATSPLIGMANVVMVPHIGSATAQTRDGMVEMAVDDLIAGLQGAKPPHLVDPAMWQGARA